MRDPREIEQVFDDWNRNLPPPEQEACRRAVRNAMNRLENVGEVSAKELVISIVLFCGSRRIR